MPASGFDDITGRALDCDSHLYLEPDVMTAIVGDAGGGWIVDYLRAYVGSPDDSEARRRASAEPWEIKGISALGATAAAERVQALDLLGVRAQLVFPNTALRELRMDTAEARDACRRYNDHALAWTAGTGGRARAVCQLNLGDQARAVQELTRLVERGGRGVLLPCAEPPAGVAPCHRSWDGLWELLAEADLPAFLHIGSGGLVSSADPDPMHPAHGWADADALRSRFPDRPGAEERIGPFFTVLAHQAAEVFLAAMVMGGTFERFPTLRFGVIEFGASWLGPLCERMDRHAALLAKVGTTTPLRPSEYVRRNVRVTPFWAEPLDVLVDRYGLKETYVFNTDYPHVEGGRDPVGSFLTMTNRVAQSYPEEFFVTNALLLFPD
jgi:predicted TIM-barrel fold metal-dependent hydrolase